MTENLDTKKVVLGLSGGVDSATAALLLKQAGYEVTGLYFDVFENNENGRLKAEATAKECDIDFKYINVHSAFQSLVVDRFCEEYLHGRTPNPCVMCNPAVKFKTLIDYADEIGAYYIATGHYGNTEYDEDTKCWYIKRGTNLIKDQTYMLYRLPQDVIGRFLMPLEGYETKAEIREIAEKKGLSSAGAKDSQEICFIDEDKSYMDFLRERGYEDRPGAFVDMDGNTIGSHKGIVNFTIGQRKGLGMTFGKPMYVVSVDDNLNTVTLGSNDDLFRRVVYSSDNFFTLTGGNELPEIFEGIEVEAKVRYAAKPSICRLSQENGIVRAEFNEPQRAAAPGQSIVFYYMDRVIGGGYILRSE